MDPNTWTRADKIERKMPVVQTTVMAYVSSAIQLNLPDKNSTELRRGCPVSKDAHFVAAVQFFNGRQLVACIDTKNDTLLQYKDGEALVFAWSEKKGIHLLVCAHGV
jgi:hypothetical protein